MIPHRPAPAPAPLADRYSRTALALALDGSAPTLDAAMDTLAGAGVQVRVGPRACTTVAGQSAALTAVATLSRALGQVTVELAEPEAVAVTGPYRGLPLREALNLVDARVDLTRPHLPTGAGQNPRPLAQVIIGDEAPAAAALIPVVYASWDGWNAICGPSAPTADADATNPLAAIAAAAMATAEVFSILRTRPAAGFITRTLNLWHPLEPSTQPDYRATLADGPPLRWLPASWHLVGLGHLGQATAWCLTFLPYRAGELDVVLQDTETLVQANISTGVLTGSTDLERLKTRVIAERLEATGARTRLVERRLDANQRRAPSEPNLAVIGVDNPETRRIISTVGWDLAVDLGLGRGPREFSHIAMHCVDRHRSSDEIPAWASTTAPLPETQPPDVPAFRATPAGTDLCGLVQLASRAAGASFVGVLAACLAISETIRRVTGQTGIRALTLDAYRTDLARGAHAHEEMNLPTVGAIEDVTAGVEAR